MNVPLLAWIGAAGLVAGLLAADLTIHRSERPPSIRRAALESAAWVALAAAFGIGVWAGAGSRWAGQYFAAYLTEKALALDNLFVFSVIFAGLDIPSALRPRVLHWGVVGALGARAVLILAGVSLLEHFWWASYLLGVVVLATGARLGLSHRHGSAPTVGDRLTKMVGRVLPLTGLRGGAFVVRQAGHQGHPGLYATPLLVALVAVEITDLAFALDSVPAVLALTTEPFLVLSSNAFAVLGLRSLYFVLDGALARLRYLKVGLAGVLVLVGVRMLLADWWEAPLWLALGAIGTVLGVALVASLWRGKKRGRAGEGPQPPRSRRPEANRPKLHAPST
ncbi:MAG: TerC/Alx family metal homeostasis membrane protein [Acidimicrobiales bacterium]